MLTGINIAVDRHHSPLRPAAITSVQKFLIMKTIVVPTDFTAVSSNAARYALELAEHLHTSVTLLHVYPIPMAFSDVPVPPQVFNALQTDAENFLDEVKMDLDTINHQHIEINTCARPGMFLTGLRECCEDLMPDAVVMSSHGRAGLERLVNGSETSATVTHLPWPLIIVPRGARFKAPKKIAIACDMVDVGTTVPLQLIKRLIRTFQADLHVLHIHRKKSYAADVIDGTGDLQQMLADLHPSYHFLEGKDVTETVLEFVEKNEIDLLMAFPKKHNLLESIFFKSQSKLMAKETVVPFMTVHEK